VLTQAKSSALARLDIARQSAATARSTLILVSICDVDTAPIGRRSEANARSNRRAD
jgi:hypothetical protein